MIVVHFNKLAVINGVTGFINSTISFSGTVICIVGFFIAIFAITIKEQKGMLINHNFEGVKNI